MNNNHVRASIMVFNTESGCEPKFDVAVRSSERAEAL